MSGVAFVGASSTEDAADSLDALRSAAEQLQDVLRSAAGQFAAQAPEEVQRHLAERFAPLHAAYRDALVSLEHARQSPGPEWFSWNNSGKDGYRKYGPRLGVEYIRRSQSPQLQEALRWWAEHDPRMNEMIYEAIRSSRYHIRMAVVDLASTVEQHLDPGVHTLWREEILIPLLRREHTRTGQFKVFLALVRHFPAAVSSLLEDPATVDRYLDPSEGETCKAVLRHAPHLTPEQLSQALDAVESGRWTHRRDFAEALHARTDLSPALRRRLQAFFNPDLGRTR